MDEKIKNFINGLGALVEMWMIVYRGFISNGCNEREALQHTQAFMKNLITMPTNGGEST